ncbi:MAG: hypothetical protein EPN43_01145 [Jatrophihabitans sp.]|nr:MAG: hypothetical protein EPN43_01145 [Jatrophihabitans sp.]
MDWFRRGRDDRLPLPGAEPAPEDSPQSLLASIVAVNALINGNAGRLPVEAVVIVRRVTDTLREVVDGADPQRGPDVYAVVSIRAMLADYLPTTLRAYLALDPDTVEIARPSGRTPSASLIEQLETLDSSADDLLAASQAHDADALLSQGSFLQTKFSGSDLDL